MLPDMKVNTASYIHLQKLYKTRAEEERATLKDLLALPVDDAVIDSFVKTDAHGLKVLRGRKDGTLDSDPAALAYAVAAFPKGTAIHLAPSALAAVASSRPTVEALAAAAQALLPPGTELPEEFSDAAGDILHTFQMLILFLLPSSIGARSPTADLPNTAAFLGGLVAQEVIKMNTKHYVPIDGYCVVDLVETWTGMV
ncbi:ubiquitin activating enzyme [Mycena olivaceomarginata]|nr:ubiquitin activating enzyme [Mycena olivaceomarginata]